MRRKPSNVVEAIWPLAAIHPAPENSDIYHAIAVDDPDTIELARSIMEHGVQEPLLISQDGFIISGHRRWTASHVAGLLEVPVRLHSISRTEDPDTFKKLLVALNTQRIKDAATLLRESLVKIDPKEAHLRIKNERLLKDKERQYTSLQTIDPSLESQRKKISEAKTPFLQAVLNVLDEQRDYWPLSVRQIHYRLLGPDSPLTHASKPQSRYQNTPEDYEKLVDLCARGRVEQLIPWEAIEDETRPIDLNVAFYNPAQFFRQELSGFLSGYWRNRQQSQPHHIEIVAEKLTMRTILRPVAQEYTIPMTIGRGMTSLPPKKKIADRYHMSQKDKLILLMVTDLDPAGEAIAEDMVKSLKRDFGITEIEPYKVALTLEQVEDFELDPSMEAKAESPTYRAFVERFGITDAYELDALAPSDLVELLEEGIQEVLDIDAYNVELAAEEADSAQIVAVREQVEEFFRTLHLGSPNDGKDR